MFLLIHTSICKFVSNGFWNWQVWFTQENKCTIQYDVFMTIGCRYRMTRMARWKNHGHVRKLSIWCCFSKTFEFFKNNGEKNEQKQILHENRVENVDWQINCYLGISIFGEVIDRIQPRNCKNLQIAQNAYFFYTFSP